ncbi:MAG: O-antigen ligase family protein [Acidobacteriota bacterium]|nr:O-antigen ligase family protein [Acidobacteriota bacterium]
MAAFEPSAESERLRTFLRYGVLAVVVLSPLPFGSVLPEALLGLQLAVAVLGVLSLVLLARGSGLPAGAARAAVTLAVALVGIGLVQLVPLPARVVGWIAPPTASVREEIAGVLPGVLAGPLPESLAPPDTVDAVLRLAAYVVLGVAAALAFRGDRAVRTFMLVVAASGAFQAVYGSVEYLSGHQHIFGYAKEFYVDQATGTLINRNHFASYLAMTLPMAMGVLLLDSRNVPRGLSWRQRVVTSMEVRHLAVPFAALAVVAMWIGVFLSYSRGGLAAALLGTAIVSFAAGRGRARIVLLALLVLPAVFLSWKEIQAPGERLVDIGIEFENPKGRLAAWRAGSRMVPRYAVLGSGYGTFEPAFVPYKPPEMTGRWDHAHNDWLQVVIEGGVSAGLIVVVLLVVAGRRAVAKPPGGLGRDLLPACLGAAVFAAAFHGLFDFAVKVPAVAVLLACQLGVLVGRPVRRRALPHGSH